MSHVKWGKRKGKIYWIHSKSNPKYFKFAVTMSKWCGAVFREKKEEFNPYTDTVKANKYMEIAELYD